MKAKTTYIFMLMLVSIFTLTSQNETKKWCFGDKTGIDFMTNPPTVFTTTMYAQNSCVSMADQAGNLLFYSNGGTVWNQNHQVMDNGSGLFGGGTVGQNGVLAVKQPGAGQLYYVFTGDHLGSNNYRYSIIDMSLAAGMGSVTVKNVLLWDTIGAKIAAVQHCNGTDFWITCHSFYSNIFRSYLLSSGGLNTSPVVSAVGDPMIGVGGMRFSQNGKLLAAAIYTSGGAGATGTIAVHDFDNSSGQVSTNPIRITNGPLNPTGIEFSPDGTKFYGAAGVGPTTNIRTIYQWDLCVGTEQAINSSIVTLTGTTSAAGFGSYWYMQPAPDGKLYACIGNIGNYLSVVNDPNLAGSACGFSLQGIDISPHPGAGRALPNFPAGYFRNLGASLEATVNCQQVLFNVPNHAQTTNGCSATGYPLLATVWNFGDNSSTTNTSTIANPTHFYTAPGTYTSQVILQYNCRADTFSKVITIVDANPTFSISGRATICVGETSTLSSNGNSASYTYSWSTGATTSSIVPASINTITTNYTVVATDTNNCATTKIVQFKVNKCTGFTELNDKNRVSIYPNPAKETIWIETKSVVSISIFNTIGELVLQKESVENGQEINLSEFSSGLYFVRISNENWTDVKPLIKE